MPAVPQGPPPPNLNPFHFAREHGPPRFIHSPSPPPTDSHQLETMPVISSSTQVRSSLTQDRVSPPVASSPLDGARLMALLTTQSAGGTLSNSNEEELVSGPSEGYPPLGKVPPMPPAVATSLTPTPLSKAVQDRKLPKGRVLKGERVSYDVDVRKIDEEQPPLEVQPITGYASDPEPVLGKQIAVNRTYICYGLRQATIRIFNLLTAGRAVLRGHTIRVTDMAFSADDVNRLASASKDGRVIVRDILETRGSDGKLLITEHIVMALQFVDDWNTTHLRICWHVHKQGILVVAIGKYVLLIDVNKVHAGASPGGFTVEKPVMCHMNNLLEGVCLIGEHDEDVTDLAMPLYISSHVASASLDGLVRIWGEKKASAFSAFTPHVGEVVGAVAFLSAPGQPENSVLLTAGYQGNRELKLWAPEEPSKSGTIMWQCVQTVEFQSSAAGDDLESVFFNQVVVAPQASLIVVANAKKNAIYVLHVQFASRPEEAQMNYLAEFSVPYPILSLTVAEGGISEGGEGTVQIYCVQTQAIQQCTLFVSQCLSPATEKTAKQSSRTIDKSAVKVPSPTSQTPLEKVPKAIPQVADTTTVPNLISDPARYEKLTAAFENLLEGSPQMTEMAKLIASTKLTPEELAKNLTDDPKKLVTVTESVTEKVTQVSSSPLNKSDSKAEDPQDAGQEQLPVPPLKILVPAKGPSKVVEQWFNAVPTDLTKNQIDKIEDRRQSAEKVSSSGESLVEMVDVREVKVVNTVSTTLGRHPSGSFEKGVENSPIGNIPSTIRRQQSGKRDDFETSIGSAQATAPEHDKSSSFSNDSGVDRVLENEDGQGPSGAVSTGLQSNVQTQSQPHHLITPSELMSLVGRPKDSDVDNLRLRQAGSTILDGDSSRTIDIPNATEIEAVQLETVNFPIGAANASDMVSDQSDGVGRLHESNVDSRELDLANQIAGSSIYSLPKYSQSDFNHTDNEGPTDLSADDGQDQSRERISNLGEIGGEALGISNQASIAARGRKNKNKTSVGGIAALSLPASVQLPVTSTVDGATIPEGEPSSSWSTPIADTGLAAQVALMQDSLNQDCGITLFEQEVETRDGSISILLVMMQSELQKQMTVMVSVPVVKEGKRLEVAMGQRMEKVLKSHVDAMWARLAEENAKREKSERERLQQITALLSNFINKDMPAVLERGLRKEFSALIPAVSQAILPPLQKAISLVINETFQKGIAEKLLPQLERLILGKLETTISRQLQTQFQSVGKQALQDAIRTSFEGYIIPAFENSCRTMFEHVDSMFTRGMAEHTLNAQQQFSSMHSPLASTLQDAVVSASTLAESLRVELTETNNRLAALVENAGISSTDHQENSGFLEKIMRLQHVEATIDPTVKLTKLVRENNFEEAFNMALSLGDVAVVSWLCNQIDPVAVFQTGPVQLSQGVLLSLVQQLGVDIGTDTKAKLKWIQEAVLALNPKDPGLAPHIRAFLEQLHQTLQRQTVIAGPGELSNQMRLVIHVVNSMLTACK